MYKTFADLLQQKCSQLMQKKMAVVAADQHSVEAAEAAAQDGLVTPLYIGDAAAIRVYLTDLGQDPAARQIIDAADLKQAARTGVDLVASGQASFLMKGKLDTAILLKEVVRKDSGLGTGRRMSHFGLFEVPGYHKLVSIVDGGMNTYPDLEVKQEIIENTVATLQALGYEEIKVGVLACIEKVNPKMPETLEADELKQRALRGEIKGCLVEGPISYDCAMSKEIADYKGFQSPCAGDCDVLLAPNIHAANILAKALTVTAGAKFSGFIVGAACPIVLTSRGSTAEEKYLSIALAALACPGACPETAE